MLYLVPTPIGNLEDITLRAIRILKEVAFILAEDTRHAKKLLQHYGIDTPVRPYHAHNEHHIVQGIVQQIKDGSQVALITDAGTPAISDPGFLLVRACLQAEAPLTCLPGPTAFVPALVMSGLPAHAFHFEGFLPHKKGRHTRVQQLAALETTFILYESPFRLKKCLEELAAACGPDRMACVCREISKMYESHHTGPLSELQALYAADAAARGEIAIVVSGKSD